MAQGGGRTLLFRQLCALAALSVKKITEADTRICPIAEGNFILEETKVYIKRHRPYIRRIYL